MRARKVIIFAVMILAMVFSSFGSLDAYAKENVETRDVLVICFDPEFDMAGGAKCHELMDDWNDPKVLAKEYISDMKEISHGNALYRISEWVELNEMPKSVYGQSYDLDEYYTVLKEANKATDGAYWTDSRWKDWGFSFDYEGYFSRFNVYDRVNSGEIDEVWFFTGPMVGVTLYESRMVGKGAFWCNSPGLDADCKLFVAYGFNYERGVGEMLEDAGHRAESILNEVFGEPNYSKDYSDFNDWEKFTAYDLVKKGCAGVGNIHWAPNSTEDYDWGNKRMVMSFCNDWKNYPNLTGTQKSVNCSTWGNGDIRKHHKWWFSMLPHADGINPNTGKENNWWHYFLLDYLN